MSRAGDDVLIGRTSALPPDMIRTLDNEFDMNLLEITH